jgi:hypothetical protein
MSSAEISKMHCHVRDGKEVKEVKEGKEGSNWKGKGKGSGEIWRDSQGKMRQDSIK